MYLLPVHRICHAILPRGQLCCVQSTACGIWALLCGAMCSGVLCFFASAVFAVLCFQLYSAVATAAALLLMALQFYTDYDRALNKYMGMAEGGIGMDLTLVSSPGLLELHP